MEINKDHPHEDKQDSSFRACCSKGVGHQCLCLGDPQRYGKALCGQKGRLKCALVMLWPQGKQGAPPWKGTSYSWLKEYIGYLWLVQSWN